MRSSAKPRAQLLPPGPAQRVRARRSARGFSSPRAGTPFSATPPGGRRCTGLLARGTQPCAAFCWSTSLPTGTACGLRRLGMGARRFFTTPSARAACIEIVGCLLDRLRKRCILLTHRPAAAAAAGAERRSTTPQLAAACLWAKDALGRSVLRMAVCAGRADIASLILYTATLLSCSRSVLLCEEMAPPLLCCAARRGDSVCVRAILAHTPADILSRVLSQPDSEGSTPRCTSPLAVGTLLLSQTCLRRAWRAPRRHLPFSWTASHRPGGLRWVRTASMLCLSA